VKRLEDVLGLDLPSLHPLLDKKTEGNLRKALSSLELRVWLKKKGVQDLRSLLGNQGKSYEDLCRWTPLDIKEVRS